MLRCAEHFVSWKSLDVLGQRFGVLRRSRRYDEGVGSSSRVLTQLLVPIEQTRSTAGHAKMKRMHPDPIYVEGKVRRPDDFGSFSTDWNCQDPQSVVKVSDSRPRCSAFWGRQIKSVQAFAFPVPGRRAFQTLESLN